MSVVADSDLELKRRGGSRSWVTAGFLGSPLAAGEQSRVIRGWGMVFGRGGGLVKLARRTAAGCLSSWQIYILQMDGGKGGVEQRQRLGFLA